jgi:hypothetical protein
MLTSSLHTTGPALANPGNNHRAAAARLVRCSRGRATCVSPINFRDDKAAEQQTQGTDLASKKTATKLTVFSSGEYRVSVQART